MTIKPKMSVIIPVYNVEKWLNKCINSVLKQTYKNIEILLINDGSTDKSGEICEKYSKDDNRIKVIHIENSGQAVARNKGIDISKGEYVLFVDSDDYLYDKNIIKKFVNILKNNKSDFIYTTYCRFNDGSEYEITEVLPIELDNNDIKNKQGKEILVDLIKRKSFHHAPYLKVCTKDFIIKNNLYFRDGYYHEDVEWSFKAFYYANRVFIYKKAWYMRRMRENSTITSKDENSICKKICDRLIIANELIKFFKDKNISKIIIDDLIRMYWGDIMYTTRIYSKDNIYKCRHTINNTKEVLTFCNKKKYKIAKYFIDIFGVNNFIKLIKLVY